MSTTTVPIAHLDGRPASADELAPLAFSGYAHFTALQVRDGRVRGLDLHLARLRDASEQLFGRALPDELVRAHLRTALAVSPADVSLMATAFSPEGEFTLAPDDPDDPDNAQPRLLIRTAPAASGPDGPLSLATVEHERHLPRVKHVGEIAKTQLLRQAAAQGFDDAAFVDARGRLSEATIWNLAFWDGEAVVWPDADVLHGTTMGIVRRQLAQLGTPQRVHAITPADLPSLAGAVVMNSWTRGLAVDRIDRHELAPAPAFTRLLHAAYAAEPLVAP